MKLASGFNIRVSVILLLGIITSGWAELRLLMSVFRHGDRYPMAFDATKIIYPLNPHANVSWFPDSPKGVTMEGKRRAYELGKLLREQYGEWLGPTYSNQLVQFRTSNAERTFITASLVAAALFPPIGDQRWNPQLNWQPIPILPVSQKDVLHFGTLCAKYLAMLEEVKAKDPLMIEYHKAMQSFYDFVSKNTGAPANNRIVYYVFMELLATKGVGLEMPKWTEGIFPEGRMKEATMVEFLFSSWTDELKRYSGGVWLKKWFEHVNTYLSHDDDANSRIKKKAYFYGGHDVNIGGIMTTLGIFYRHIPNYTSTINFELHEDEDRRFYVKVLHRDSGKFAEHIVPGCESVLCPLETFKKIFAKVIPDGPLECGVQILPD